jgi:hypothetical protein
MIAVSSSTVSSIVVPVLILGTALVFPIAQRHCLSLFQPRTSSAVGAGTPDEWLQRCCDRLEAAPHFSIVEVSEYDHLVRAKYRRPPTWADLTVKFTPEEQGATRINTTVRVLPNLLTLVFGAERRLLGRFERAIGVPSQPDPRRRILR